MQLAGSTKVTQELSKLSLKQRNEFWEVLKQHLTTMLKSAYQPADYVRLTKLRGIINEINTK